jgi:ketosteroid isomerase-like protein
MSKAKLRAATVGGKPDDVETAFYEALQNGDITQLMACWADEDEIVCIHPGGSRLVGSGAIRAAFETLFASGGIAARPQRVRKVESLASAMHNVLEQVEVMTGEGPLQAWVIATNVYHKTPQGWRMVAHHASPGSVTDLEDAASSPLVLH